MTLADFPKTDELTNETIFSGAVEDDSALVPPGRLVFELTQEEGGFVAVEPYTGMFGEGETEIAAVQDLVDGLHSLRDLFTEKEELLTEQLANPRPEG